MWRVVLVGRQGGAVVENSLGALTHVDMGLTQCLLVI